ncbi:MAG: hypothetical protein K1X82_01720 [Bacteroidia bacterium]|nr:hypothetical protein [Bacteroidia bacterium]
MCNIFNQNTQIIDQLSFCHIPLDSIGLKLNFLHGQKELVSFLHLVQSNKALSEGQNQQKNIIKEFVINHLNSISDFSLLDSGLISSEILPFLLVGSPLLLFLLLLLKFRPKILIQKPYLVLGESSIDHLCISIVNLSKQQDSIGIKTEAEIINDNITYRLILEEDGMEIQSMRKRKVGILNMIVRKIDFAPIDLRPKPVYLKDLSLLLNSPNTILKIKVIAKHKMSGICLSIEKKYRKIIHNYYEI